MDELTLEQAKEQLMIRDDLIQRHTAAVGTMTTDLLMYEGTIERKNKRIKELEASLQQMVDATKQEDAE